MKASKEFKPFRFCVMISMLLLTNACGLKGDLYIPAKETSNAPTAPNSGDDRESESQEERNSD